MELRKESRSPKVRLLGGVVVVAGLMTVLPARTAPGAQSRGTVLFASHFADLAEKWTVWDDPSAKNGPSQWRLALAELSGITKRDRKPATALLAGSADASNYAVETSLYMVGSSGHLTGIVFGHQGPDRFYIAGYNFGARQYELEMSTPAGFELLQAVKKPFPSKKEVPLRVEFTASHIRLVAGGEAVIDLDEGRIPGGRYGLGCSSQGDARVHFGPVRVTALEGAAAGKVLFEEDFSSADLAKWEIWDDPSAKPNKSRWSLVLSEFSGIRTELNETATAVLAGEAGWGDYAVRTSLFAAQGNGDLSGIVFGFQDTEHFYIAGYNFGRTRFELAERTERGFSILAFAEMEFPREEWHPLEVEFRGGRIIFSSYEGTVFDLDEARFRKGRAGLGTSRLSNGLVLFGPLEVTSLASSEAPKKGLQDLLSGRRGAAVIYRPRAPESEQFREAVDHSLTDTKHLGNVYDLDLSKVRLPEEAVFSFPQGRFAEIRQIGIALAASDAPKEIRFWTSLQNPKAGFEPLATVQVEAKRDSVQTFDVPPTKTKYLKVQIASGHSEKFVRLREIFVRGLFLERPAAPDASEELGPIDIREKEPNNTAAQAQAVPLGKFVGGTAAGDDADLFRIGLKGKPAGALTISFQAKGIIRPRLILTDESGRAVQARGDRSAGGILVLDYDVGPGDHTLKVERPDSYLTLVYDDSSSMGKSIDIVKSVLKGYLDNLGPGLSLQLMKYADSPIFLSGFTNRPDELRKAVDTKVGGGGGTETLKGLTAAVKSVAEQPGSRAVLAIFDDLQHSGSDRLQAYIGLWDEALDKGVSFTTIGVQSGWDDPSPYFTNSQEQIFRELAYSSLGGFFRAPTDEKVKESAERVFELLTSPLEYRFIAEWRGSERRSGSLEVKLAEGAEPEAAKSVEIIMDASNSMWGQIDGVAKITIAREVLTRTIGELPETMNVGLRAYGHRFALNDAKACADTELLVPIGPVDKKKLTDTVNAIQLKGKTPLVHSVLEAIKDFEKIPGGSIVLVTDGIESCGGDIASIAPAIKAAGLELRVHIVGFDIKEKEARAELESIAASTGGRYIDARNADELKGALGQTLTLEYVVLDAQGAEVARGVVGGPAIELDSGSYTVRIMVEPEPVEAEAVIDTGSGLTLTLKKAQGRWILD